MATAPLIPNQIEAIFQKSTILAYNLDPQSDTDPAYTSVRIGWQEQGQPAFAITEDVTFVRCTEVDDNYNRVRDERIQQTPTYGKVVTYTRVWEVHWTIYGPNSFDNARIIRSSLLNRDDVHDLLAGGQLYLVTDMQAPQRVPELFQGQWWERVDFSARFNEAVTEDYTVGDVQTTDIKVYTPKSPDIDHPAKDITVT